MIAKAEIFCLAALLVLTAFSNAAELDRPNLLVIFTDDQLFRAIGYCNDELITPNLDALASEGLIFERAYIASPICCASRASMMSGVFPQQHGVISLNSKGFKQWHQGGEKASLTLPNQLGKLGYTTALYGKSHIGNPTKYGFELGRETKGYDDKETFAEAFKFLSSQPESTQPFFLWLSPRQPHVPLKPKQKWLDLYNPEELTLPANFREEPPQESLFNQGLPGQNYYRDTDYRNNFRNLSSGPPRDQATIRQFIWAYYATISHLDHQIGQLVKHLEDLGLKENTVIVFLSDNGYHLGSHGLGNKITMHEESVRIPMFAIGPGIEPGTSKALISSIDLYPTLLELAGGKELPQHAMGKSFVPLLNQAQDSIRDVVFSECVGLGGLPGQGHRMVRNNRWKLILTGRDELYLFDQQNDPHETTNVINNPEHQGVVEELRGHLATWMEEIGDRTAKH